MIYEVQVQGYFSVNCYFIIDEETGHGFLIDPGAQGEALARMIRQRGWTIEKILLTHGHFDHTGGIEAIRRELDIPVYIHRNGEDYLTDPRLNLSRFCGPDVIVRGANFLRDGDTVSLKESGACSLRVLHTPGHTPDSVTFYCAEERAAFVGDAIFKGSPGTAQYPGGNGAQLIQSVREKILRLPEDTTLYSGHSEPTRVEMESHLYYRA